jgi:uncharacterized repeat protein (TIGR01451 family)
MKLKNAPRATAMRLNLTIFFGIFIILAAVVAVPVFSGSSGSTRVASSPQAKAPLASTSSFASWSSTFQPVLSLPVADEGITTYSADCVTQMSDFVLGETVCAKATGVPTTLFPWKITWVDPAGFIRQSDEASPDESTTYMYQPDEQGNWSVNLTRANGAVRQTARFTVHEAANPHADVYVQKFARDPNAAIFTGSNIAFTILVGNAGPDPALVAQLLDSAPSGATLSSFTQQSGPACLPAGEGNCSMATLTNGDTAQFTAIYNLGESSPGTYTTSASVSNTVADQDTSNNSSTAEFQIQSGSPPGNCALTCPSDITANANTTEGGQRGAHVTYPDPEGTGTCGSITSTPASGSFFPVGTTVVSATSETGEGSCNFTVTVEESNGNVSISCPSNQTATANNDCEAIISVGSPTTTGDNVTFHGVRSDGKPMYNCDCFPASTNQADDACNVNGACTRKPDAPFPAGVTTITWIAYSHNTPGPYATPEDEEAARTGGASCTQTITVNDTTPPAITAQDSTVSADANCQAPVPDYSNDVSDNCSCAASDNSQDCVNQHRITTTQDPAAGTMVGPGAYTIHIIANDGSSNNDGAGNTTEADVTFTVKDTTAPTIQCPANITTNTESGTCSATVDPGTATATDNCDTAPTITGTRSDNQPLDAPYPKGTTTITWTAKDHAAPRNESSCQQTVTVEDHEAPVITTNGQTPTLWPANHAYHTFNVTDFVTSATDNCNSIGVSNVVIQQVTSDETENGGGDGNTFNDIIIAADCKSVQVRAERRNSADGRVYTITFKVTDSSGNVGTKTATIQVPKNLGVPVINSGPNYTVTGTCP